MPVAFAQDQDLTDIVALLAACDLPADDIAFADLPNYLVAREGPELVGVVGLELLGEWALLRSLAVALGHRGRGLGTLLVARAEGHAAAQEVSELYLLTTTAESFFAGQGYARVDRASAPRPLQETSEFRTLCPHSAICMCRRLPRPSQASSPTRGRP